jgi:hypothetical protein
LCESGSDSSDEVLAEVVIEQNIKKSYFYCTYEWGVFPIASCDCYFLNKLFASYKCIFYFFDVEEIFLPTEDICPK